MGRVQKVWAFPIAIIGLWLTWFVSVLLHGDGFNIISSIGLSDADYERAAQFGDAFGSLSSLMAALAAAGAWFAVSQTRIQAFESTFYSLLAHHNQIVLSTDIQGKKRVKKKDGKSTVINTDKFFGRDAFKRMLRSLRLAVAGVKRDTLEEKIIAGYRSFHDKYTDDLAHYFRTLYHMIRFIDESSVANKALYAKIVRAQLSDSEQILLMYNCSVGKGRQKFKSLVEKYSLLHNVSFNQNKDHWENTILRKCFESNAFRDEDTEAWPTSLDLINNKDSVTC